LERVYIVITLKKRKNEKKGRKGERKKRIPSDL
jgi:hypothetical protein